MLLHYQIHFQRESLYKYKYFNNGIIMGIINLYACIGDPENHKFFHNNRNKAEKVLQKNATPFSF